QASIPTALARFCRTAWASSVVLPNPGPATSAVTGRSNRPASSDVSRSRTISPLSADGGPGEERRLSSGTEAPVWVLLRAIDQCYITLLRLLGGNWGRNQPFFRPRARAAGGAVLRWSRRRLSRADQPGPARDVAGPGHGRGRAGVPQHEPVEEGQGDPCDQALDRARAHGRARVRGPGKGEVETRPGGVGPVQPLAQRRRVEHVVA